MAAYQVQSGITSATSQNAVHISIFVMALGVVAMLLTNRVKTVTA